jgi:hypothetical protein
VQKYDVGWAFRAREYDSIRKMIEAFRSLAGEIAAKGANARRLAETTYSKMNVLSQYRETLTRTFFP